MSYFTDEISKLNMDREKEHTGQSFVCRECGCAGVVGKDLYAATTTTTQGYAWFGGFTKHVPSSAWKSKVAPRYQAAKRPPKILGGL